jgi:hypothetical protein
MSDLHRAVQAELDAHTPGPQPSFDLLLRRKRTRDRRRAGLAAALSALAAAVIALVPSTLLGGDGGDGGDPPARVAGQPGEVYGFHIKPTRSGAGDGAALQPCLSLPGVTDTVTLGGLTAQFTGRVTGRSNADALEGCVRAVPGWEAGLYPWNGRADERTYTVQPAARTVSNVRLEEQRAACFALPGVQAVDLDESLPVTYRVTVPAAEAPAFERCIRGVVGLYVPEIEDESPRPGGGLVWTGVTVCRVTAEGDGDCQRFGEVEARVLDDALEQAVPAAADQVYCAALTPTYSVKLEHPSARTTPFIVPTGCGPMQQGGRDYLLPPEVPALLQQLHADAGTGPSVEAFVRRCLAPLGELPAPAAGHVGRNEAEVAPPARVVGRDGSCLPVTRDDVPGRVDVLVVRGKVVWAVEG